VVVRPTRTTVGTTTKMRDAHEEFVDDRIEVPMNHGTTPSGLERVPGEAGPAGEEADPDRIERTVTR